MILGRMGWLRGTTAITPPPEPGDWNASPFVFLLSRLLTPASLQGINVGSTVRTIRFRIRPPAVVPAGDRVRFRFLGPNVSGSVSIIRAFATAVPLAQENFNADEWSPVLFDGSQSLVILSGQNVWSDFASVPGMGSTGREQVVLSVAFVPNAGVNVSGLPLVDGISSRDSSGDTANQTGPWIEESTRTRMLLLSGAEFGVLSDPRQDFFDFSSFLGYSPSGVQVTESSFFSGYFATDNQLVEFSIWAELEV